MGIADQLRGFAAKHSLSAGEVKALLDYEPAAKGRPLGAERRALVNEVRSIVGKPLIAAPVEKAPEGADPFADLAAGLAGAKEAPAAPASATPASAPVQGFDEAMFARLVGRGVSAEAAMVAARQGQQGQTPAAQGQQGQREKWTWTPAGHVQLTDGTRLSVVRSQENASWVIVTPTYHVKARDARPATDDKPARPAYPEGWIPSLRTLASGKKSPVSFKMTVTALEQLLALCKK